MTSNENPRLARKVKSFCFCLRGSDSVRTIPSQRLVAATGIVSIYGRDAFTMNAAWRTISEAYPDRFILGLGVSHRPMVEGIVEEADPPHRPVGTPAQAWSVAEALRLAVELNM